MSHLIAPGSTSAFSQADHKPNQITLSEFKRIETMRCVLSDYSKFKLKTSTETWEIHK